jgi:hypothetical protein
MDTPAADELWDREAYDGAGERLGRIEAVGMGRDRVPRRVGVRSGRAGRLRFFTLVGARIVDGRVVIELREPSLRALPGDSDLERGVPGRDAG